MYYWNQTVPNGSLNRPLLTKLTTTESTQMKMGNHGLVYRGHCMLPSDLTS